MKGFKQRYRHLSDDNRGELYIDVFVKILLVTFFLATVINFFAVFTKMQNTRFLARQIVREIEVKGAYDYTVRESFAHKSMALGINGANLLVTSNYWNYTDRIQLGTHFEVEVVLPHTFIILSPPGVRPLSYTIDLRASLSGMSEVFWK